MGSNVKRCDWCGDDSQYQQYHDLEWGVPCYDSRQLFEQLCLEGAMAGLSWLTILRKRERYRTVFHGFDPRRMSEMDNDDVVVLMQDSGIVRHRGKIEAFINNACAFLHLEEQNGPFAEWIWAYVQGSPIKNAHRTLQEVPAQTPIAAQMSRDLKAQGFKFVGPTTCYAFMQAAGLVNDHLVSCFRYDTSAPIG